MGLIDKSIVIKEIERKRNNEIQWIKRQGYIDYHVGLWDGYDDILYFLDHLESKEVGLEKEIEEVKHNYKVDNNRHTSICSADIEWIAEHFFELGLKTQKRE